MAESLIYIYTFLSSGKIRKDTAIKIHLFTYILKVIVIQYKAAEENINNSQYPKDMNMNSLKFIIEYIRSIKKVPPILVSF